MTLDEALRAVRSSKEGVLVDTNLLLLLLAGSVDRGLIAKWKRTNMFDDDDFDLLSDLLGAPHRLVITPHVATEVSNLATSLNKEDHRVFFELFGAYLTRAKELSIAACEVATVDAFTRLGLTDTAILRFKRRRPLVITDDLPLAVQLASRGQPVVNFNHLRAVGG